MDLKILAAGSNREIVVNITDYLKNNIEYDITECEQAPGAIAKALSELSPNVLILCLGNETPESLKNYDEISSYEKADLLVTVVVASEVDFNAFLDNSRLKNIQYVPRPVSRSSIFYKLEEIKEMFDTGEFAIDDGDGGEQTSAGENKTSALPRRQIVKEEDGDALSAERKRILVVDDDPDQLAQIKGHLQDYYRVTAVRSGAAALKYLENHDTDLILLDYIMPGMDGPSVLEKLRSVPDYRNIPVVFLTGVSEKETIIKTLVQLKPQGYLVKPAKKSEIIAKIIDVLG